MEIQSISTPDSKVWLFQWYAASGEFSDLLHNEYRLGVFVFGLNQLAVFEKRA